MTKFKYALENKFKIIKNKKIEIRIEIIFIETINNFFE